MDFPRRGHQRLWSKILSDKPIAGFADCTVNNNYKPLDGSGVENTYKFSSRRSAPSKEMSKCCVYCGSTGPLTDDHVPPKVIFTEPRSSNLITVPACAIYENTSPDGEDREHWHH